MKTLVYDGDCPFCRGASASLLRWLAIPDASRRPLGSFEGGEAARLVAAGAEHALAVLDSDTGEIHTGVDGILRLARGSRFALPARVAALPPLRQLLDVLYRFVARNRRTLFGPRARSVRCACESRIR